MSTWVDPAFQYAADVIRWVDGDTLDVTIDLGFMVTTEQRLRLYGIDTPERGKKGYKEARQFCEGYAPAGTRVVVKTHKTPEKYGRYLAVLYLGPTSLNDILIEEGHAVSYFGGAK